MATNARTLYLDDETYGNLGLLAGMKRSSRSSVIRSLIKEEARQARQRQPQPEDQFTKEIGPERPLSAR